jgi:RNA polymerase sigma factor (sigma-70 family)
MTLSTRLSFLSPQARRFDALVRPHLSSLYAFALRLQGNPDDAQDLVQEVLTKLYPRTPELAAILDLKPWLQRVLYNQFIDATRRQQSRPAITSDAELDNVTAGPEADPAWQLAGGELAAALDRALAQLDPDQRALVALHLMDGRTLEDLTAVFGVPLGTLKSRLHRTRARLQRLLGMEPSEHAMRVVDEPPRPAADITEQIQ